MNTSLTLGAGLGLKADHYEAAFDCAARGVWFEVHPENYMIDGGPRLAWLETIGSRHPLSLHGVSLSLAADCAPDVEHLQRLKTLIDRVQPALVSEHLAWSTWRGQYHPTCCPSLAPDTPCSGSPTTFSAPRMFSSGASPSRTRVTTCSLKVTRSVRPSFSPS